MDFKYFGKIPFSDALRIEEEVWQTVLDGGHGKIVGFETSCPTITLGVRANIHEDIRWSDLELSRKGFEVFHLERGGQATLHNPGQLVIFPIMDIRDRGVRQWVDQLLAVTAQSLLAFGKKTKCDPLHPGLYSERGKVAAIGIRIRNGISTHGISINVHNDLQDFQSIRPCGRAEAAVDQLGQNVDLDLVFHTWVAKFQDALAACELTRERNLTRLCSSSPDARL